MADIAASAPASPGPSTGSPSAPPASATASSAGESTVGQPQAQSGTEPPQSGQPQSGEPPRERWNDILENTRKKTRAEVEAELQSRYQPYEEFARDPLTNVLQWLEKADKHPLYGPVIQKHYQSRTQQPAQALPEPQPDVPIVDERGYVTGKTYSADRLKEWQRWNHQQNQSAIDARFGPLEADREARAHADAEARAQYEANQHAHSVLTELRQQPHYKENEPKIRDILLAHPEWGANVHRAYMHFMHTEVLPKLGAAEATATIDSLTQQGDAATVAPGSSVVGMPNFKGDFGRAAKWFTEHPEEAALMARRRQ